MGDNKSKKQNLSEQDLSEQNLSEQDLSEQDLSEQDLSEQDLSERDKKKSNSMKEIDSSKKKIKSKCPPKIKFYLNNDDIKPISAGGVIIYKMIAGEMFLLMIESRGKYEDIGGKVDKTDSTFFQTISREVQEETNNVILEDDIIDRIESSKHTIYVPKSKYVITIVEATKEEINLVKDDFGDHEIHDSIPRTIGWISRSIIAEPSVIRYKLHWRLKLKHSELFSTLKDIENNHRYRKKKMF